MEYFPAARANTDKEVKIMYVQMEHMLVAGAFGTMIGFWIVGICFWIQSIVRWVKDRKAKKKTDAAKPTWEKQE